MTILQKMKSWITPTKKILAINKKNLDIYEVINDNVINCTNTIAGQRMVYYTKQGLFFVREYNEFIQKFELL